MSNFKKTLKPQGTFNNILKLESGIIPSYTCNHMGMDDTGKQVKLNYTFTGEFNKELKSYKIKEPIHINWFKKLFQPKSNIPKIPNIFDDLDIINKKLPLSERIYLFAKGIKLIEPLMRKYDESQFEHSNIIEYNIPYPSIIDFNSYDEWHVEYEKWIVDYDKFRYDNNIMTKIIDYRDTNDDNIIWVPDHSILPEGVKYAPFDDDIREELATSDDGTVTSTIYFDNSQPIDMTSSTVTIPTTQEEFIKIKEQVNKSPENRFPESEGWVKIPDKIEIGYDLDFNENGSVKL